MAKQLHFQEMHVLNLHDILKLYKHGYSKVTDHACREIRHKRLDRYNAQNLVLNYEIKTLKYIKYFCEWLNIDKGSYNFLMNLHRNKKFWKLIDWDKKVWSFNGWSKLRKISRNKLKIAKKNLNFISNDKLSGKTKIKYYIIGKGYL